MESADKTTLPVLRRSKSTTSSSYDDNASAHRHGCAGMGVMMRVMRPRLFKMGGGYQHSPKICSALPPKHVQMPAGKVQLKGDLKAASVNDLAAGRTRSASHGGMRSFGSPHRLPAVPCWVAISARAEAQASPSGSKRQRAQRLVAQAQDPRRHPLASAKLGSLAARRLHHRRHWPGAGGK